MHKSKEDLFKEIWKIADDLKGPIKGWDFKNYILGFLFYKYISEDFADCVEKELVASGDDACNYEDCDDKEPWIENVKELFIEKKGYFIYPSQLFSNVRKATQNNIDNLNEILGQIFKDIESSTQNSSSQSKFKELFRLIDLNSINLGQEILQKNKRLKEIIDGVSDMKIGNEDPELYGDAYRHLIGMYSSNLEKQAKQAYTPPEVSQLMANLASEGMGDIRTVYDPACGSGSLLLKFKHHKDVELFGQEIAQDTHSLCRMNMFLSKINFSKFDIRCGDTLINDLFEEKKFDIIVSNPPYSSKWISKDDPLIREDKRFYKMGGLAPRDAADFAFIQHALFHLEEHGVSAIACYPGILYRGQEKNIREWFIKNNHIDAIIQLPEKLFFKTPIAPCIMILKKSKPTTDILFVDASTFFEKRKNNNILTQQNIEDIVQLYRDRKDVKHISKVASTKEIEEQDYALSVRTYVPENIEKEEIDIDSLNQSIFERAEKIQKLVSEVKQLIEEI